MTKIGRPPITTPQGSRFGRWVTLETITGTQKPVRCRCDCGTERAIRLNRLKLTSKDHLLSCGCANPNRTHGRSGTPEHAIWAGLFTRCENPNHHSYRYYGARGIAVCERWRDFAAFYADMGDRPSPKHSIERENTEGPYALWNCVWATPKEQSRNRRNVHYLTVRGVTKRLVEWAEIKGVSRKMLLDRLSYGWSHEDIVERPVYKGAKAA